MRDPEQQLDQLLALAATEEESASPARLHAPTLLRHASTRRRRSIARRALIAAGCIVVGLVGMYRWTDQHTPNVASNEPATVEATDRLAALEQSTRVLAREFDQAAKRPYDLVDALLEQQAAEEPSLAELQSQVAALEEKLFADTSELDWQIERYKSAALRMELAHLDAAENPSRAAHAYRQIATTYSDTRWGEEARRMLSNMNAP